jgi:tetratricopeptide (TPR) repeat protein
MRIILIAALVAALGQDPVDREVQRIAMEGWAAARAIAPKGGALDLLGPVNLRLRALDGLPGPAARYADVAIRAAISAAQEERDEMAIFLAHARDLSATMAFTGAPSQWPLPIDELEGELRLEVDQYTEARDAYQRATKIKPTANAWIGLARANDRLGDTVGACAAYLQVASTPGLPADVGIEVSVYILKCRV